MKTPILFSQLNLPSHDRGAFVLADKEDMLLVINSCGDKVVFNFRDNNLQDAYKHFATTVAKITAEMMENLSSYHTRKEANKLARSKQYSCMECIKFSKGKYITVLGRISTTEYYITFRLQDFTFRSQDSDSDSVDLEDMTGWVKLHGGYASRTKRGANIQNAQFKLKTLNEAVQFLQN